MTEQVPIFGERMRFSEFTETFMNALGETVTVSAGSVTVIDPMPLRECLGIACIVERDPENAN